ncbi:hypothetical protein A2996_00965 [Candidatus Campbellbacteria bacterium RIFCSPLOWO2_01_FULL_34_15]|uniref:Uncharacterized protein n=2 Tax=Candidatus Campbelliibacteriota TaxID=1752727 RepID=A0A1F5EMZ4_9BACT|nr:MAG: hypothetical protein A2996_00965 [Candidatus Campbellbacteria bacterium RIFCSPLOWO2_01_FULL_34_15]OGD69638.1 MAG: hypothetical protein A2811_02025 [Candidatus Campbellbacteria bacterium RIFCSPHIGHO2_01_FULL_34_10]
MTKDKDVSYSNLQGVASGMLGSLLGVNDRHQATDTKTGEKGNWSDSKAGAKASLDNKSNKK